MGETPPEPARTLGYVAKRLRSFPHMRGLRDLAIAASIFVLLIAGYLSTQTLVLLRADGQTRLLATHQTTVDALLAEAGVELDPPDFVEPDEAMALRPGLEIIVRRAYTVQVEYDGQVRTVRTQFDSPWDILNQLKISLGPGDQLFVDGALATPGQDLKSISQTGLLASRAGAMQQRPKAGNVLTVKRATALVVDDNNTRLTLYTTAPTVGEALQAAGISLYLGDHIRPGPGTRVAAGLRIEIRRSVPVTIAVDGRTMRTRTFRATVGDVLAELGIALIGEDYSVPIPDAPLSANLTIQVIRVQETLVTEQSSIPFDSVWRPDPNIELDHTGITQVGAPGVLEKRFQVRYEDGREVNRAQVAEWVALPPTTHVNGYGTKIVYRTLDTTEGPVQYWRVMRMWATAYTAASTGKTPGNPTYGITRTGLAMRNGIVAVDPTVINLLSRVYVPGYGIGLAADTGGGIKGRWIDLGYEEGSLKAWAQYTDVYLLAPAPANIDYVLGTLPDGTSP